MNIEPSPAPAAGMPFAPAGPARGEFHAPAEPNAFALLLQAHQATAEPEPTAAAPLDPMSATIEPDPEAAASEDQPDELLAPSEAILAGVLLASAPLPRPDTAEPVATEAADNAPRSGRMVPPLFASPPEPTAEQAVPTTGEPDNEPAPIGSRGSDDAPVLPTGQPVDAAAALSLLPDDGGQRAETPVPDAAEDIVQSSSPSTTAQSLALASSAAANAAHPAAALVLDQSVQPLGTTGRDTTLTMSTATPATTSRASEHEAAAAQAQSEDVTGRSQHDASQPHLLMAQDDHQPGAPVASSQATTDTPRTGVAGANATDAAAVASGLDQAPIDDTRALAPQRDDSQLTASAHEPTAATADASTAIEQGDRPIPASPQAEEWGQLAGQPTDGPGSQLVAAERPGAGEPATVGGTDRSQTTERPAGARPPSVTEQIVRRAELFTTPLGRGVEIQLEPPELGRLQIRVVFEQGELAIHLGLESAEAMSAIQDSLPQLREALADRGLAAERFSFDLTGRDQQDRRQFEQPAPARLTASQDEAASTEETEETPPAGALRIDYRI